MGPTRVGRGMAVAAVIVLLSACGLVGGGGAATPLPSPTATSAGSPASATPSPVVTTDGPSPTADATADATDGSTTAPSATAAPTPTATPAPTDVETTDVEARAVGWLGGTPPASVVAQFSAVGLANGIFACAATLPGPDASPTPGGLFHLPPALVEALRLGRVGAERTGLDPGPWVVGAIRDETPARLPGVDAVPEVAETDLDEVVARLDPVELRDLRAAESGLPADFLDELVVAATEVAPTEDAPTASDPTVGAAPTLRGLDGDVVDLSDLDPQARQRLRVVAPVEDAGDEVGLPLWPPGERFDAQVLWPNQLCGDGWEPGSFVHLTITDAAGAIAVDTFAQVWDDGGLVTTWVPEPDVALGTAVVRVDDGTTAVEDTVRVVPAREPRTMVLGEHQASPGEVVRVGVSGVEPAADVALQAYVSAPGEWFGTWDWVGSVPVVTADVDGQAVVEVPVAPDHPPGTYCLLVPGSSPGLVQTCSNASMEVVS